MDTISEFLRLSDLNGFPSSPRTSESPSSTNPGTENQFPSIADRTSRDSKLLSSGITPQQYPQIPFNQSNHSQATHLAPEQFDTFLQESRTYSQSLLSFTTLQSRSGTTNTNTSQGGGNLIMWNNSKDSGQQSIPVFLPVGNTVYVPSSADAMPQMPSPIQDDTHFSGGRKSSQRILKLQKGRQRSSGPLSAHAVYARMNRERKKKYIAELEQYRASMKKKQADNQQELDKIRMESEALTLEISTLRNILLKNGRLMSLLTLGTPSKK